MSTQYPEQLRTPIVESTLADWREYGGLYRLEGTFCPKCKEYYYPHRYVCPKCYSLDLKSFEFCGQGTILSFYSNNASSISLLGFREHNPRLMITVKLLEGPVIVGELVDVTDIKLVNLGAKVTTTLRKCGRSSNTIWKYGYKFILDRQSK